MGKAERTSLLLCTTAIMLLPLLVLGLANFICCHILQTNLINGNYRYKEGPYDGPLTGMDQYFAVWGVDSSVTDLYKANPYTETWTLNEDGTGLTIAPISPGEKGADILEYQWGKEGDTPSPLGSLLKTVITLVGPNTVQVVSKDEKAGITDTQIYRFTPAGAQKTSIATKERMVRRQSGQALKRELTKMAILLPWPSHLATSTFELGVVVNKKNRIFYGQADCKG